MDQPNTHPAAPTSGGHEAIADYLRQEISALELANLLDEHLHTMIQLYAASGEAITQDQASAYHHIRRLRDLLVELSNATPVK